jgi:hypothetical protein
VLLTSDEIFNLNEYYKSPFINSSLKKTILAGFYFLVYRFKISDITRITPENIVGDTLIFLQNRQNSKEYN